MFPPESTQAPFASSLPKGSQASTLLIRPASLEDMAAVQAIYAYHVLHSTATFEQSPPDEQEMRRRFAQVQELGLPWLVAQLDGQIVGYAYATSYRSRPAYRFTVENAIYLAQGQIGKGLGKALLEQVVMECEKGPWRQMVAIIAGHDSRSSIALHRSLGFAHVGTQPAVGYKFQQWIDVVIMQRSLGEGSHSLPATQV
ncbi:MULTISPECIES: GNAT family N-acetyltransferase [Alcaligenes]|uniref:GNAT family N-acetyltransferase n=1 Tax=Alcaligenes sp. SJTW-7 TaxID=3078429 RepID=UPI0007504EEF|nr:N-acetyltransferase family protein [Alcaligenes faecalis]WGQ36222.1 GNAT family N-acetyltransferase [Alcaligenes faecalis]